MYQSRWSIWLPCKMLLVALLFADNVTSASAQDGVALVRVGVLAHRGPEAAVSDWLPLMDYLSASIANHDFELVPVTLISTAEKVSAREIEFLITNPGHFVTLAEEYPVSAIATRKLDIDGTSSGLSTYGTAVLVRAGSGITSIAELRGKRVAAVSRDAFGGFQVAWSEMRAHGVNAFDDLASLSFMGFPQDDIANAVLRNDADAGIVRSGLLEKLESEGRIARHELHVLNSRSQPDYPYRITGHLYPEWPFVSVPGVSRDLADTVLLALLGTHDIAVRREFELSESWSSPASYEVVRKLVSDFRTSSGGEADWVDWPLFWVVIFTLACAGLIASNLRKHSPKRITAPGGADAPRSISEEDPTLSAARAKFQHLTPREREILSLICEGEPSKSIASKLGVSPKTVEFHRANLLKKTEAGSTAHLVQLATRLGFDLGFSRGKNTS